MSMARLRFVVDALQFMVDGKAEFEGETLRGLYETLEDAALQLQAERRHVQQELDRLKLVVQELTDLRCQQVVDEFKASLRK